MFKKNIPNFLTSCNLLCGCIGITMAFNNQLMLAASMIWIAAVFDFLDGFSARLLKVHSEIGKQLDSLADMVTFGVLPAFILFAMLKPEASNQYLAYVVFLVAIFSAVRLAKFNIDPNQSSSFIGLPTPANAIFISSLPFVAQDYPFLTGNIEIIVVILAILLSWLLVAPIEMLALKFKDYSWKKNSRKYVFLMISIVLLLVLQISAIPLIIVSYVLISLAGSSNAT